MCLTQERGLAGQPFKGLKVFKRTMPKYYCLSHDIVIYDCFKDCDDSTAHYMYAGHGSP